MVQFMDLVKARRSANNFLPNQPITQSELNEIFDVVKLAPSAYNLQHAKYICVTDPEMKEKIREVAFGQYKVVGASAVIIVLGDKKAYQQAGSILEGLKMLGILKQEEYDQMVSDTIAFYETKGEEFQRDEAIRNASISGMLFLLAAKEKGWDTCPMIGFDPVEVKKLLNIDEQHEPVLMITIGKEKVESRSPRGYRRPVREFVTYI